MTDFETKTGVVISQLRADRDRLLDALNNIKAEIEKWHKEGTNFSDIRLMKIEDILDKYNTEISETE